jgi:hypothetical protein
VLVENPTLASSKGEHADVISLSLTRFALLPDAMLTSSQFDITLIGVFVFCPGRSHQARNGRPNNLSTLAARWN